MFCWLEQDDINWFCNWIYNIHQTNIASYQSRYLDIELSKIDICKTNSNFIPLPDIPSLHVKIRVNLFTSFISLYVWAILHGNSWHQYGSFSKWIANKAEYYMYIVTAVWHMVLHLTYNMSVDTFLYSLMMYL